MEFDHTNIREIRQPPMNPIYLVMIVKNEEHVIADTLRNIVEHIPLTGFIICDTGSTDKTVDVIMQTMGDNNIKLEGIIKHHEWKDFAFNRNKALHEAKNSIINNKEQPTYEPYFFMFDADDRIEPLSNDDIICFPNILTADAYSFKFKTPDFSYNRTLLIKSTASWCYKGVVHECLCDASIDKTNTTMQLEGNYTIISGRSGNRNKDPEKYKKDALLLEKTINEIVSNTNTNEYANSYNCDMIPRYAFYCAQSWKDYGDNEKAVNWYKQVVHKYPNWTEEKYYACLMIAKLLNTSSSSSSSSQLYYLLLASSFNPHRLEAVYEAAQIYIKEKQYTPAYNILLPYAEQIILNENFVFLFLNSRYQTNHCTNENENENETKTTPSTTYSLQTLQSNWLHFNKWLFTTPILYTHECIIQLLIVAYYIDDHSLTTKIVFELFRRYQQISKKPALDNLFYVNYAEAFLNGLQFYLKKIQLKSLNDAFFVFDSVKQLLKQYAQSTSTYQTHVIRNKFDNILTQIISKFFHKNNLELTNKLDYDTEFAFLINKSNAFVDCEKHHQEQTIIATITTCKRLDYFLKTMRSIMSCFSKFDLHLIDKWFVVDDGSSPSEIIEMLTSFPFITMIHKRPEQKGHRGSMNVIYDLLVKHKPKYWLHLEDDWVFAKQDHYISKAIRYLETPDCIEQNVKQILFNKGYGETIGDVIVPCGEKIIEDELLLHIVKPIQHTISDTHCIDLNYVPNCNYWKHYSFRPSLTSVDAILQIGNFYFDLVLHRNFFEADYAEAYVNAGFKSCYFNDINCLHIGRLSGQRGQVIQNKDFGNGLSAYELNNIKQF